MVRWAWLAVMLMLVSGATADEPAPKGPDPAEIARAITELGDERYAVRQAATKRLLSFGKAAIPALKAASRSEDPEVQSRARLLLRKVGLLDSVDISKLIGPGATPVDRAVALGLVWLRTHQSKDGLWRATALPQVCGEVKCRGTARMDWVDPGVSGLALLAFLGAGHTDAVGAFEGTVQRAAQALIRLQQADGSIGPARGHYMYNHAIATLALTELYAMTQNAAYRAPAERAATWLLRARNPGRGWRYRPRSGDSDISVTSWATYALKSASVARLQINGLAPALNEVRAYADTLTDDSYGVTGYTRRPPRGWQGPTSSRFQDPALGVDTSGSHAANHTPTAMAAAIRAFSGTAVGHPTQRRAAAVLGSMVPVWDVGGGGKLSKLDYYYWYHGSLATFQLGGAHWTLWRDRLRPALVTHQSRKGHEQGSWDPKGAWGFAGGRIYATAINLLSLEIIQRSDRAARAAGGGGPRPK